LVLGIDAREGYVAVQGWTETSPCQAVDAAQQFAHEPLAAIVYTDISTDGMLSGPNLAAMAQMRAAVDLPVVASGGVTTVDDVARLAAVPMAGCLTLPEALVAADDRDASGRGTHGGGLLPGKLI
jgi:phosphoribosylformimino-5-aminoimidazole carboxamide ribotide isomerase